KSFRKTFDREGSKGIEAAVARLADFLYSVEEFFRRAELAHHTVNVRTVLHHFFSSDVSATSSRISAMEIAGRTRTKRKRSVTNMPMGRIKGAQPKTVGRCGPQQKGRRSAARLSPPITRPPTNIPNTTRW